MLEIIGILTIVFGGVAVDNLPKKEVTPVVRVKKSVAIKVVDNRTDAEIREQNEIDIAVRQLNSGTDLLIKY